LTTIEAQFRTAIRDAVNDHSRKPFHWGGLSGYGQMEAVGQALPKIMEVNGDSPYWQRLSLQVTRVLEKNRALATDLQAAHSWLERIAACLHYPPKPTVIVDQPQEKALTSQQVTREMEKLLAEFQPDGKNQPAQAVLKRTLRRAWKDYGQDLLPCYDIPGLTQDNLKLESFFHRLRCHQRRISGRKSTRELRDFGQFQVLCTAESEEALWEQIRKVPLAVYRANRQRLAEAETPRQFLYRLHRNPVKMMQTLADQYTARLATLQVPANSPPTRGKRNAPT
jgi:hypothetical protein